MWRVVAVVPLVSTVALAAGQEGRAGLTLESAMALARARAPSVLAADTELRAEQASRVGATPLFARNPSLEGGAGGMLVPAARLRDWRDTTAGPTAFLGVAIPIEIAAQRWSRVAAVDARIAVRRANRDDAVREALFSVGEEFFRVLHAQRREQLAEETVAVATRWCAAIRARQAAGDASRLDVRIADAELATAEQALLAHRGAHHVAKARLAALLGAGTEAVQDVTGDLVPPTPLPSLEDALAHLAERADIRAVRMGRGAALREANVAAGNAFPSPTLKSYYQYWNREHALMATVEVPLPIFDRGQGEEARARARASGLAAEHDARLDRARMEVTQAWELARTLASLREVSSSRDDAMTLPADLEEQLRSHRVELATVLLAQRQVMQLRAEALDLQLLEAMARLWLDHASGVLK